MKHLADGSRNGPRLAWALAAAALVLSACSSGQPAAAPTTAAAPTAAKPAAATAAPAATTAPAKPADTASKPAEKSAAPAASADWDKVVADAKREGKVSVITHPSTQWSGWVPAFQRAYPEIKVEHLGMRPSDVTPRVISEQQNGQFLYDVMVGPTSNSVKLLAPTGAFQDIRPFIVLPDAKDEAKWNGGLMMFADKSDPFSLVTAMTITNATIVNRKLAPASMLSSIDDLVKPELKGKIAIYDPTAPNNGSFALAYLIQNKGEGFARQVMENAVVVESSPDVTNFVQSGRYWVGLGSDPQQFAKLQSEGRAADLELNDMTSFAAASGIAVMKNTPNPNAARVLVNWFLSKEGQEAYARDGKTNSRRVDVQSHLGDKPGYAEPDWNNLGRILRPKEWQGLELVDQATKIGKEMRR